MRSPEFGSATPTGSHEPGKDANDTLLTLVHTGALAGLHAGRPEPEQEPGPLGRDLAEG